ncbi:hypothetical protein pb186bvf_007338 [Paramecium bursaria]
MFLAIMSYNKMIQSKIMSIKYQHPIGKQIQGDVFRIDGTYLIIHQNKFIYKILLTFKIIIWIIVLELTYRKQ